jgi:ferritin-like metal-binding protein YciE
MERLKQAVSGNDLHRELSAAYFEAAESQVAVFLGELAKKPMAFTPPVRGAILAHMEEWRGVFEHDGLAAAESLIAAARKAGASMACELLAEDMREQVAIASPAEQPDEAA